MSRILRLCVIVAIAASVTPVAAAAEPPAVTSTTAPVGTSELQFSVRESALFELLRAVTPYTLTVGSGLASVDLILHDPAGLELSDGKARFRIGVRGATIPLDQMLEPELRVEYDSQRRQYFVVVTRFTVQVPLVGTIDLREALPPLAIPALVEQLWGLQGKPIGTRLHIRRIAIADRRLDISADVDFLPIGRP